MPDCKNVTDLRACFIMGRLEIMPRLIRTLRHQGMTIDEIFLFLVEVTCEE